MTTKRPRYLALALRLEGEECVVVGGGAVGSRKAKKLAAAGASVTIVAPDVSPACELWLAECDGRRLCGPYDPSQLDGATLVVAATDDPAVNARVAEDARLRGLLCCNAGPGAASQVIFPAEWTDDDVVVSVHTHGADCLRSRRVRDAVASLLDRGNNAE